MDLIIERVEWQMIDGVHPDVPMGRIRREGDGFRAWAGDDDLGYFPGGDEAAVAVWERDLEKARAAHERAARRQ